MRQSAIGDYGLIGDCRTAALVSREGSIDWLCLPHFSAPSVFARLLDQSCGGHFAIRPSGQFDVSRRYIDETAVLETTFRTSSGTARLIDCVAVGRDADSLEPTREVLRCVEGVAGEIALDIVLDPRPDYGRLRLLPKRRGEAGWCYAWANEILFVRADADLAPHGGALHGSLVVRPGERRYVSLSYMIGDIGVIVPLGRAADDRLDRALTWWRAWSARCAYDGRYRTAVLRSALTLKLLSFSLSGAILAAPTTSLPETIGGSRNWDYRYCWLRDAGLTMQALVGLGYGQEARAFLGWLLHATRLTWPELRVLYDVYGRIPERERLLDLAGYRGSRPVRIGNGAAEQLQLDVYGEVILAADAFVAGGGTLDPLEARMLAGLGEVVCRHWRSADHSIWEIRGAPRHYTFSKVMCWLALDRLLKLGEKSVVRIRAATAAQFRRERRALAEAIETRGFNSDIASYVSEFDGDRVDASLLLMACLGYKPAADPRMVSTFDCIMRRLETRGLLYRYEATFDGLEGEEGAFGLCGFWAVDNLVKRGALKEAEERFARLLGFANDLGLFAEETDPETGAALGNFPQAFTHVGVINTALAIDRLAAQRG